MKQDTTFIITISPYWSDMDALGHINNAAYFTYFEEARIRWIEEIGLGSFFSERPERGPLVYEASCKYLKQVKLPSEITIEMTPHSPGKASFLLKYMVYAEGDICAEGSTKIVWADYKAGRPVRLPEDILRLFT